MLNITYVSARQMLRGHKKVFERVKKTGQPTVILSRNKPQVAVVAMEDLKTLERHNGLRTAKALLELAEFAEKNHIRGPKDLSVNHNKYAWD